MDVRTQLEGERLALVYGLSQIFGSSLDLNQVLNRVIDEVLAAVQGERGFVMLSEPGGLLSFRVARGMDQQTIGSPHFQVSRGVVEQVASEGRALLTSDAQADDRLRLRRSVRDLGLRSIMCAPLTLRDRVTGVIYVDNRLRAGIFQQADLELLSAIASSAAMAIENARLYQVAVEKGRMESELQVARELQAGLLPADPPSIAGWDVAARWLPAREVSGDYYDFVPLAGGALTLVIGDVCDKGMSAALFMALSRSIIRASLDGAPSPAEGLARANRLIEADAAGGMFVTLCAAQLEPDSGTVTYVNAGHNPPLLARGMSGEGSLTPLPPTGMALGVLPDSVYEQRRVDLDSGDLILFYTDGVLDARSAQGEAFGKARLGQLLREQRHGGASQVVAALGQAVEAFAGEVPAYDDITILVARRACP
ncbi:MAG TPA: SpoIIE family protein phosphatase [Anaerolineae bacterium]|nr:SpoIIE family protein phosphatase [Anaerolineae bacterium]